MDKPDDVASGQAEIENTFTLSRRGLVLVFKDSLSGIIPRNGTVRGQRGASAYAGPEIVSGWDASGSRKAWLAVIARADAAATLFRTGDIVLLFP